MPLKWFICPDGKQIEVSQCLAQCPNPAGRCLSLPTLYSIGRTRVWNGKPSTTQLLNPTRLEYLQLTKDFAIDPYDQAFALLGTRHHQKLEAVAKKLEGLEAEKYLDGEISGIADLIEPINGGDQYRMIDYKTFGSFAVAKLLDLKDGGEYDRLKLELQMNNYRLMAQSLGFDIVELKAQITIRDGNTFSARNNGIDKNIYLLSVKILPDDKVQEYFATKAYALKKAIETNQTELCNYEERWGGRRCKGFCSVYMYCPEGAKVNKVELQK